MCDNCKEVIIQKFQPLPEIKEHELLGLQIMSAVLMTNRAAVVV